MIAAREVAGRILHRRWISALIATTILFALTFALDPGGYLGTDTGGKVATLEVMTERGSWEPHVGYWAEDLDPTGRYHPLFSTRAAGDEWVQVTTLPMIYAARPLYEAGGYRLALLLPIAGSVLAALAARSLAGRLGVSDVHRVFWVYVFASPMLVYALDLWEHSLGVALMAWAFIGLFDVAVRNRSWVIALASGASLSLAATMRTEALVYALVMVASGCLVTWARRGLFTASLSGIAAVVGFAPVWLLNMWVEDRFDSPSRADRALGAAEAGVSAATPASDDTLARFSEGVETLFSIRSRGSAEAIVLGIGLALAIGVLVRRGSRLDRMPATLAAAVVGFVYLAILASGPGFVNGLVPAFPIAAAAVGLHLRRLDERMVVLVAVTALPIVWAFQYLGGAGPQWGGRYVLESGALLGVVGMVSLLRADVPRPIVGLVIGASLAVNVFGVVWLVERSNGIASAFEELERVEVDGLAARNPFILREGGAAFYGERWLSANIGDRGDIEGPLGVFDRAGLTTVGVLQEVGEPVESGLEVVRREPIDILGFDFEVVVYRLD